LILLSFCWIKDLIEFIIHACIDYCSWHLSFQFNHLNFPFVFISKERSLIVYPCSLLKIIFNKCHWQVYPTTKFCHIAISLNSAMTQLFLLDFCSLYQCSKKFQVFGYGYQKFILKHFENEYPLNLNYWFLKRLLIFYWGWDIKYFKITNTLKGQPNYCDSFKTSHLNLQGSIWFVESVYMIEGHIINF
jgi:hypothetical protein